MVVYSTIRLQSPSYNNAGSGRQIYLPVIADGERIDSLAEAFAMFGGNNRILDLGQAVSVVQLSGMLTDEFAVDHGYVNALDLRQRLRQIRRRDSVLTTPWSLENGSGNWGSASLPAEERDASTSRATGKTRLIYDRAYLNGAGTPDVLDFLYGAVANIRFGPRNGATGRVRIAFALDFLLGTVDTGTA